jgi:hypothetical protein
MADFQKGHAEEPRRNIEGSPRPGGDFLAPGKKRPTHLVRYPPRFKPI